MIIGLSGYGRSGKDTVGKILSDELGYIHMSFAAKLKDFLYAVNPLIPVNETEDGGVETERLQELVEDIGWERAKDAYPEVRELLQRTGTDAGRKILGWNIWVEAAMQECLPGGSYSFTDCRFPNEAQAIIDRGGQIWRVSRDGYGPTNSHESEVALDKWNFDRMINNNGTIDDLRRDVLRSEVIAKEEEGKV